MHNTNSTNAVEAKKPSEKQMVNRMLGGHAVVLQRIENERPAVAPNAASSELRGAQTMLKTLLAWGAIQLGEPTRRTITPLGRRLLVAYDAKWGTSYAAEVSR